MDSTRGQHYQRSGSLPSDYALVSRYAQHNSTTEDNDGNLESSYNGYVGPSHSSMDNGGLSMKDTLTSETTPLLTPVSRIEEPVDHDPSLGEESYIRMIREELPILSQYAFPVFGQAISSYATIYLHSNGHLALMYLNIH